jgi:hypothetical protein
MKFNEEDYKIALGVALNEKEELKLDNEFKTSEIRKYIGIIEKQDKLIKRNRELANEIVKGEVK